MINDEYGFDLNSAQARDNLNYEIQSGIRRKKNFNAIEKVEKGPKDISHYMKRRKPTEWIISSFGARGACVLLAGDKGEGKTSFLYQLGYAVSRGEDFLNEIETIKSKVLMWQADESEENCLNKCHLMGIAEGVDYIFAEDGWVKLDIPKLRDYVKLNGYEVVLLDSISTLLTNEKYSFKDPEFASALYELNKLASELKILIVINSHLTKAEREGVSINDILGSGQISSAVSDIWSIYKSKKQEFGDHYVLRCLGKRNCEKDDEWNIQGNKEDLSFTFKNAGKYKLSPSSKKDLSHRIIAHFSEFKKELSINEISEKLKSNTEHTRRVCTELFCQNKLGRKKRSSQGGRPYYLYFMNTFPT